MDTFGCPFFIFCDIYSLMGKVTVTTMTPEGLLKRFSGLPPYKTFYSWDAARTADLISDIDRSAGSGGYSLGTVIFCRDELVDGEARIITLALIFRALGLEYPSITKYWTPEELRRIKDNQRVIARSLAGVDRSRFRKTLLEETFLTCITTEELTDSFSFFDSGRERGRELDCADILKAYHLVSMRRESESDKSEAVSGWESLTKDDLLHLLSLQAMLWHWLRGEGAYPLTKEQSYLFEGVEKDRKYPYVERVIRSGFCLESPMINGKWFFDHTFHYMALLNDVYRMIREGLPSILRKVDFQNPSEVRCMDLFLALALFAEDRFGADSGILLPKLFMYAFSLRLENASVTLERINAHVLAPYSMLTAIRYASDVSEVLSYNLALRLDGMKNVAFRTRGPVRDIDFEKDFDFWLKEGE